MGDMKANRKFREGEEAVSAVIGVILMVAITVAIAATVYVYVTGMIGGTTQEKENASVTVEGVAADDRIKVILAAGGQQYDSDGYDGDDITIYVNDVVVTGIATAVGTGWTVGEPLYLGSDSGTTTWTIARAAGATAFPEDDYTVTVTILDTVVADATVHIT